MVGKFLEKQSPAALAIVLAMHFSLFAVLVHDQPKRSPRQADVLQVNLIVPPEPLRVTQQPALQKAQPKPHSIPRRRDAQTIAPPPKREAPSEAALSLPPEQLASTAAAEPAPLAASAPPALPAPPAPTAPPRFDADYLKNPAPTYPALARRLGEQGRVLLRVVVRPDGTPEAIELRRSSGSTRLDEAALEAVKKWRFVPARHGDTPITATVIVPIVFSLDS